MSPRPKLSHFPCYGHSRVVYQIGPDSCGVDGGETLALRSLLSRERGRLRRLQLRSQPGEAMMMITMISHVAGGFFLARFGRSVRKFLDQPSVSFPYYTSNVALRQRVIFSYQPIHLRKSSLMQQPPRMLLPRLIYYVLRPQCAAPRDC